MRSFGRYGRGRLLRPGAWPWRSSPSLIGSALAQCLRRRWPCLASILLRTRSRSMNAWIAAACMILVSGAIAASQAQQPSTTLSPAALKEIADVEAEIDRIEAQTLARLTEPPNNQV